MTRITLALAASLAIAAPALAADTYQYRFAAGKPLIYKTKLVSEGSFALPDGTPRTVKLAAQSTVELTPEAPADGGWRVSSRTTRAQAALDGTVMPAPKGADARRTMTVRPDGTVTGGDDQTLAIAFPARPLARGDRFSAERKAVGEGLPLTTTYTLVDTAASLPGHPGKLAVFEAKSKLAKTGRKVALKRGGGKIWFDAAAGVLVKSELAYEFSEETALPGAEKPSTRTTMVSYVSELVR